MVNTFESIDYILSICYHLFYMIKLLLYNLYVYIYNEFTLIVAISLGLQIYWKMAWTNLKATRFNDFSTVCCLKNGAYSFSFILSHKVSFYYRDQNFSIISDQPTFFRFFGGLGVVWFGFGNPMYFHSKFNSVLVMNLIKYELMTK